MRRLNQIKAKLDESLSKAKRDVERLAFGVTEEQFLKAVRAGDLNTMEHFLNQLHAEKNIAAIDAHYGSSGATALHIAAECWHTAAVELLIRSGADISAVDNAGRTPLFYAREANVVPLLSRQDIIEHTDRDGNTALIHLCSANVDWQVIQAMIMAAHANVNAANRQGVTALMHAASHDNGNMFRLLLANGATRTLVSRDGRTADDRYRSHVAWTTVTEQRTGVEVKNSNGITDIGPAPAELKEAEMQLSLINAKELNAVGFNALDIPDEYCCRISFQIMDNPVHYKKQYYDRDAFIQWYRQHSTDPNRDPITQEEIQSLKVDEALKSKIENFVREKKSEVENRNNNLKESKEPVPTTVTSDATTTSEVKVEPTAEEVRKKMIEARLKRFGSPVATNSAQQNSPENTSTQEESNNSMLPKNK